MSETTSNPWKFIAIGCGVIALLACCCSAIGFFACGSAIGGPPKATHELFDAAKAGRTDAAYALMATSFQASHPKDGFAAELAALPGATTWTDVTVSSVNTQNSLSMVSGSITAPSPVGTQAFSAELVQEGAVYKVQAITIGAQTLR